MAEVKIPKGRPDDLWPLFAGLETLDGVGPKTAKHYKGLGVETPKDLILTLPVGGVDRTRSASIRDLALPGMATVEVVIGRHRPPASRGRPYRIEVEDAKTSFQLVFFHGKSDYLSRILPTGARRIVSGKVELFDGVAQMPHPDHILAPDEASEIPAFEPIYPLAAGLTQKGLRRAMTAALAHVPILGEWIDIPLLDQKGWPAWDEAVAMAHAPKGTADLAANALARERLAFDELFAHQLTLALARASSRRGKGRVTQGNGVCGKRCWNSCRSSPRVRRCAPSMRSPPIWQRLRG